MIKTTLLIKSPHFIGSDRSLVKESTRLGQEWESAEIGGEGGVCPALKEPRLTIRRILSWAYQQERMEDRNTIRKYLSIQKVFRSYSENIQAFKAVKEPRLTIRRILSWAYQSSAGHISRRG